MSCLFKLAPFSWILVVRVYRTWPGYCALRGRNIRGSKLTDGIYLLEIYERYMWSRNLTKKSSFMMFSLLVMQPDVHLKCDIPSTKHTRIFVSLFPYFQRGQPGCDSHGNAMFGNSVTVSYLRCILTCEGSVKPKWIRIFVLALSGAYSQRIFYSSSWASLKGSRLYIWYPRKLPLLTISRLWRYCGHSNHSSNFLLYWYAAW